MDSFHGSPPQLLLVETRIHPPDYAGPSDAVTVENALLPGIIGDPA
jgi:hypothetical protein